MTVRGRLILLSAVAVAVAVCLAAVGAYLAVRSELRGQVDDALRGRGESAREAFGAGRRPEMTKFLKRSRSRGGAVLAVDGGELAPQLVSRDGNATPLLGHEAQLPVTARDREIAARGGQSLVDARVDGEHLRILTVGLRGGGAVQFARALTGVDNVLAGLRMTLALLAIGGVAVAVLLAWLVASGVIAPIRRLTAAAEHVSETEDLSRRIEVSGNDEIGRLAARFNGMLETIEASQRVLEQSVQAQRQLVADASHELRTPVASLRTDVDVLLAHPELPPAERERVIAETEERIAELGALIEDVIELARGDTPAADTDEVRFDRLVEGAVRRIDRHAPERHIELDVEPTVIEANANRISRAINNLLENACKYSPAGAPVIVSLKDGELRVRDHGPGVPADERDQVFDRFYRGRGSRQEPGSGLGLAIVRQVAESHGGTVSVSAAADGGAVFSLWLPPLSVADCSPLAAASAASHR